MKVFQSATETFNVFRNVCNWWRVRSAFDVWPRWSWYQISLFQQPNTWNVHHLGRVPHTKPPFEPGVFPLTPPSCDHTITIRPEYLLLLVDSFSFNMSLPEHQHAKNTQLQKTHRARYIYQQDASNKGLKETKHIDLRKMSKIGSDDTNSQFHQTKKKHRTTNHHVLLTQIHILKKARITSHHRAEKHTKKRVFFVAWSKFPFPHPAQRYGPQGWGRCNLQFLHLQGRSEKRTREKYQLGF